MVRRYLFEGSRNNNGDDKRRRREYWGGDKNRVKRVDVFWWEEGSREKMCRPNQPGKNFGEVGRGDLGKFSEGLPSGGGKREGGGKVWVKSGLLEKTEGQKAVTSIKGLAGVRRKGLLIRKRDLQRGSKKIQGEVCKGDQESRHVSNEIKNEA